MTSRILESDTHTLESKHSGKYISHFLYDVGLIANMVGTGVLNLMKDSLTLIVLIGVMFYQNWKLACFCSDYDAPSCNRSQIFGKKDLEK